MSFRADSQILPNREITELKARKIIPVTGSLTMKNRMPAIMKTDPRV